MKEKSKKTLEKLEIDYDFIQKTQKEAELEIANILTKASLECEKLILQAEAKCNRILSSCGGKIIIKHNINYNLVEK